MKLLQINCSNKGSTGNIMHLIADGIIARGDKSVICYSFGSEPDKKYNEHKVSKRIEAAITNRLSYIRGYLYGFAWFSTFKVFKIIKKEKPDIVHLHCPNSNLNVYKILGFLKKKKLPTVLTNHCEMFYTANCPHSYECEKWKSGCGSCENLREYARLRRIDRTNVSWKKMQKIYSGFEKMAVTSVSSWVYERSKESTLLGKFPNYLIENGLNTDIFKYTEKNPELLNKYKIDENKKLVLFVVANFTKEKGKDFFIEIANKMPSVSFLLVGSTGNENDIPENVINIGKISSQLELAELYHMSDVTLLLSKKETFSMVAAESLCCGTQVVGFKAGGPESIAIPEYSEFCDYGDIAGLISVLENALKTEVTSIKKQEISQKACDKFSNSKMVNSYLELYDSMI